MNRLAKSLLVGLLEQENYITAFYGGGFKPPTKGHFAVIKKSLEQFPDIDKFYIVVGSGIRDGISQDESYSVWNIYKKYLGGKVEIIKADSSPLKYIKDYIKTNTDHKSYIFIGSRDDKDEDAQDFIKRKSFFENYGDHVEVKNILTKGGVSGTKAREAAKISKEQFFQFLPNEITDEERELIFDYVQTIIQENIFKNIASRGKELSKNFIKAFKDQKGDFKGFKPLVIKYLNKQELTPEEKEKLKRNFTDILKLSGVAITFPVLGATGNTLLGWLTDKLTKGKFTTLPSKFKDNVLEEEELKLEKKKNKDPFGLNQFAREIMKEEESFDTFDYPKHIKGLTKFMLDQGLNLNPLPSVKFVNDDIENASNHLKGKTAYYDPNHNRIVLYTLNRHPKDVMRSFAHEMIHHMQNCEDRLGNINTQDIDEDDHLKNLESEAYQKGNLAFRSYTGTLTEGLLVEGRYDKLTTQISGDILKYWKNNLGKDSVIFENSYEHEGELIDIEATLTLTPNIGVLKVDGGADEETDFIVVNFEIDPNLLPQFWEEISFNLKDVIRHEVEHLTHGEGFLSKPGKYLENDELIRQMIDSELLSKAEYFKLEKEIDANLQGMYFRAKKERRPLKDVINVYLDAQDITPEEKQEILKLWDKRAKELNLPNILQENLDPSKVKIYLDMDGVLADFDQRFQYLSGMTPSEFEAEHGKQEFWDFIDEEHKVAFWVGIPVMNGAPQLVKYASKYPYEILTAPSAKKQSLLGKSLWIKKHMDLFGKKPKVNFKKAKNKHLVKPNLTKYDILVDDRADTINRWNEAGGTGILYTSASQVINDMKKIGL